MMNSKYIYFNLCHITRLLVGPFYELLYLLGRAETMRRLKAFEVHVNHYLQDLDN